MNDQVENHGTPSGAADRASADALDAKRYRWLCTVGQHRDIPGSGSQVPGRGPYVAMSFASVYAPAGSVALESKEQIDSMIDAGMGR